MVNPKSLENLTEIGLNDIALAAKTRGEVVVIHS